MTFVYKASEPDEAQYSIEYYFAEKEGGSYTLDKTKTQVLSGKVGDTVTLNEKYMPEYINGYKLNKAKSDKSGVIASFDALTLKLYYDKVQTPVTPQPGGNEPGGSSTPDQPGKSRDNYQLIEINQRAGGTIATDSSLNARKVHRLPRTGARSGAYVCLLSGLSLLLGGLILAIRKK